MLCLTLISLLLHGLLAPQVENPSPGSDPGTVVTFIGQNHLVVRAGEVRTLGFNFRVDSSYHIQSNDPADPNFIPTRFSLEPLPGMHLGEIEYPEPNRFTLDGGEDPILVFERRFNVAVPVTVPPGFAGSRLVLRASLHYQACDLRRCFFPRTLEFDAVLEVLPVKPEKYPGPGWYSVY